MKGSGCTQGAKRRALSLSCGCRAMGRSAKLQNVLLAVESPSDSNHIRIASGTVSARKEKP